MHTKLIVVSIYALLSVCNSAFVDTLKKCSYKDEKCNINFLQNIVKSIGKNGIDELNIPGIDPYKINDIDFSIPDFFTVTLSEGEVNGIPDCSINKYHNDLDKGVTHSEIVCDFLIKTKFHFDDAGEFIRNLFGKDSKSGDGAMEVKIDKFLMKIDIAYDIIKTDEGIFLKFNEDKTLSDFEVENIQIKGDKITFGTNDITELVENFFNQNWKTMLPTSLGKKIFNVAVTIMHEILRNFYGKVSAEHYFIEDITPFVKN